MPSPISDAVIEQVAHHFDIVDVIGEHVRLKRAGRNYLGLCPFHHEKTPSFTVDPERQLFYCFGCQTGGNIFTFIQKRENLTFVEAVQSLAERAGIAIAQGPEQAAELAELRHQQRLYDACQAALQYFRQALQSHPDARKARHYLVKRGVEQETIEKFQLGYAPPDWRDLAEYLQVKGFGLDILEQAGLVIRHSTQNGYYDRFRDRLMFPIFDGRGRSIGFGGRVLDDSQPKYLNSPQTPIFDKGHNLYGIHLLRQHREQDEEITIFEGYMDLITAWQGGVEPVVASLGTALTTAQARLLKRYSSKVIICYDADVAGESATRKGMELLKQAGLSVRVARVPSGKDPDEFIRNYGADQFKEQVLRTAPSLMEYHVEILKKKYDLERIEGKADFTREFVNILNQIDNAVEVEGYLRSVASQIDVTEEAIRYELAKARKKAYNRQKLPDKSIALRDDNKDHDRISISSDTVGLSKAEALLIAASIAEPRCARKLIDTIVLDQIQDQRLRALAAELWQSWQQGAFIDSDQLSLRLNSDMAREALPRVMAALDSINDQHERAFDDSLEFIQSYQSKKELPALIAEFNQLTAQGDEQGALRVLKLINEAQAHVPRQR